MIKYLGRISAILVFLAFVGLFNSLQAQDNKQLSKHIDNMLKRDSINELIIHELKTEIKQLKEIPGANSNASMKEISNVSGPHNPVIDKFIDRGFAENKDESLFGYLLLAFVFGLLSLATPCVYPMVPLTVTFFTNDSQTRGQAVKKALLFGVSIIFIFTVLGLVFNAFKGPGFASAISTHWLPNVFFSLIFLVFGLSFLGLFEITLPASLVNKVDRHAEKGGILGIFFMALTLVLVSFSCTIGIVGNVLVQSFEGQFLKPVLGMLAYSLAFAIPFAFFAFFPSLLTGLPKSGGWLNVIKVVLGFVELAFALKFFSTADQAYHWGLLDRDVYIAFWIALSALLGLYFLGKIKTPHDSDITVVSVPRLVLAVITFTFAIYLLPGMFGAPLKALSGLLPPISSHDFDVPGMIREYSSCHDSKILCEEPKHAKRIKMPHGLKGYFDYKQAVACAKEKNLPLLIDFTGFGCVSCRLMEENVWADQQVLKVLNNDYMIVQLYTDDKTELSEKEKYISPYDKHEKTNVGELNLDLETRMFENTAQPWYILLDPYTEKPLAEAYGYNSSIENYLDFLEEGKKNFAKLHPR